MKLLTACVGVEDDDHAFTVPGELVYTDEICDRGYRAIEADRRPECGCSRSFTGVASGRFTTLAVVDDIDITFDMLTTIVIDHFGDRLPPDHEQLWAQQLVDQAAGFGIGEYVRRNIDAVLPADLP